MENPRERKGLEREIQRKRERESGREKGLSARVGNAISNGWKMAEGCLKRVGYGTKYRRATRLPPPPLLREPEGHASLRFQFNFLWSGYVNEVDCDVQSVERFFHFSEIFMK